MKYKRKGSRIEGSKGSSFLFPTFLLLKRELHGTKKAKRMDIIK
jgi:hypothetical protein